MTCVHLRKLYKLCEENKLKFSGSDLVHIVCKQCKREEVCPSVLLDEYDQKHPDLASDEASETGQNDAAAP